MESYNAIKENEYHRTVIYCDLRIDNDEKHMECIWENDLSHNYKLDDRILAFADCIICPYRVDIYEDECPECGESTVSYTVDREPQGFDNLYTGKCSSCGYTWTFKAKKPKYF